MQTVNRDGIASIVAKQTGLTVADAKAAVNATFGAVKSELAKGNRVTCIGFGTFKIRHRAARNGVNPQTKQAMVWPAKNLVKFVVGKAFDEEVN